MEGGGIEGGKGGGRKQRKRAAQPAVGPAAAEQQRWRRAGNGDGAAKPAGARCCRGGRVAAAAAAEHPSQPSGTCGGGGPGMEGDVGTAERGVGVQWGPGRVLSELRRMHWQLSLAGGQATSGALAAAPLTPHTSLPLPLPQVLSAFDVKNGRVPGNRVVIPKVGSRLQLARARLSHPAILCTPLHHPESTH